MRPAPDVRSHMRGEYFYGAGRNVMPKRPVTPSRPATLRGEPATGRIARILTGQGYGFVRLPNDREIFFHRGDLRDGTTFNDLRIGDAVAFEILEDSVSGARALRLVRRQGRRTFQRT